MPESGSNKVTGKADVRLITKDSVTFENHKIKFIKPLVKNQYYKLLDGSQSKIINPGDLSDGFFIKEENKEGDNYIYNIFKYRIEDTEDMFKYKLNIYLDNPNDGTVEISETIPSF